MLKILQSVRRLFCVTHYMRIKLISEKHFVQKYIYRTNFTNMTINSLLYRSVESILEVFNKDENKDVNGVKELLTIYNNAFEENNRNIASGEVKKHPLIVLEGLDGSGKSAMGKRLAKKLNGVQCRTPPDSINHLRHLFDDSIELRTAFYSLGNYIAALEVQSILRKEPVVMDRYWHSTAAYAIAQAVADNPAKYTMPPSGDKIYCWPDDLFKPDIVILLQVSEEVRLERHSRRATYTTQEELLKSSSGFRQKYIPIMGGDKEYCIPNYLNLPLHDKYAGIRQKNEQNFIVLQAYKNMCNPEIEVVDGNYSFSSTLGQLQNAVRRLFD